MGVDDVTPGRPAETRAPWRAAGRVALLAALAAAMMLGVRWNVVAGNVMWWDDFAVPQATVLTYLGSYRPLLFAEYHAWELLVPGHFWAGVPKWAGLAYATAAVILLTRFLRRAGSPPPIAFACSLLVGVHPIATDALFWSSLSGMGLALILTVRGAEQVWFEGRAAAWSGAGLIALGALGYQWLLAVAVVLVVGAAGASAARGTSLEWRRIRTAVLAIGAAAAIALCWMAVTRWLMPVVDERGWPPAASVSEMLLRRYHGWTDNLVNVFMPPVAAILGFRRAWSLWKWVPISWAVLAFAGGAGTGVRGWRLVALALLPAGLAGLGASFTLVLPWSTYAWRTSLAALVGFSVGVAVAAGALERRRWGRPMLAAWGAAFFVAACFTAWVDDGRRAEGYFSAVRAEHGARGQAPGSGARAPARDDDYGGMALTVGYDPMGRRAYSPYADEWVALRFREFVARTGGATAR